MLWNYTASHKFWDCASKTTKKNSKQIFLFKVIAINCNTLIGTIFQPMNCSQIIIDGNSLQFRRYRCLNVAYGCISVPLQLYFQIRKRKIVERAQIRRVRGMLSLLHEQHAVPIVLLSIHATQIMHTVFVFSNYQTECRERWFLVSRTLRYHPTTSATVFPQNSRHLSDVFVHFRSSQPSAPLCVFNLLLTRCKLAMPSKYCSTRHRRVTKRFYKHFPHFRSHKSHFTTKFYCGTLFQIFFPW